MADNNRNETILASIRKHASEETDKLCVADKTGSLTYGEFWKAIVKASRFLTGQGVRRGDIVVIRSCQKTEYTIAFFGLQLAGGIVCPMERGIKDGRILEIMSVVDADLCIAEKPLKTDAVRYLALRDVYAASQAPDDSDCPDTYGDPALPSPDELAEILFTTGTTGKSKGIEVTHGCDVGIAQNVNDSVEMTRDGIELLTTPMSHSLAIRRTFGAMYIGSSIVLCDGVKFIEDFFTLLDRYRVTAITFVPAILEQVLRFGKERFASYDAQLNYIQLGSAPLSEENKTILREMFPNVRLYNTYGATESGCTIILEFSRYSDKKNCIGRTTVNTELIFVDEDRNRVAADRAHPAYLAFRGPMNMRRYYKEPALTAEVMDEEGTVYTNDIGYPGEDGLIYLLGRKGDVINVGGIKVAPTEIEEAAMKSGLLSDCACIPIPDEITGEAVKMFVVPVNIDAFNIKDLQKDLINRIEALKIPKSFEIIGAIPRTFNGKIIRKDLKARGENK